MGSFLKEAAKPDTKLKVASSLSVRDTAWKSPDRRSEPINAGFCPPHSVIEFQVRRSMSSFLSLSSNLILVAVVSDDVFGVVVVLWSDGRSWDHASVQRVFS